jgi:C1A family cysteine protease
MSNFSPNRLILNISIVTLISAFSSFSVLADSFDMSLHGRGVKRPSPEELALIPKRSIIKVRPNALALDRVNKDRGHKKQAELSAVLAASPAEEIVYEQTLPSTSLAASPKEVVTPALNSVSAATALPTQVDNSLLKSFPPVGNQGGQGSCASYSTTYYIFSHETCLARGCDNSQMSSDTIFSPKFTYNMINGGTDGGSWPQSAFALLIEHGAATLKQFPYSGSASDVLPWDLNATDWLGAINYRALSQQTIDQVSSDAGMQSLKQYLANGHLASFATCIPNWKYYKMAQSPGGTTAGVGQTGIYAGDGSCAAHAMTIVGYDDQVWVDLNQNGTVDSNEKGAFKIVNQWGTGFGTGGFAWVPYTLVKGSSQILSYNTVYTLQARPAYNPLLVAKVSFSGVTSRSSLSLQFTSAGQTWTPSAFRSSGGSFTFDGKTANPPAGTFFFDLSSLVPAAANNNSYSLLLSGTGLLSAFSILEPGTSLSTSIQPNATLSSTSTAFNLNYDTRISPPVATVVASPTQGAAGVAVSFDGTSSKDVNGFPLQSYSWDFGDGTATLEGSASAQHTYAKYGNFTAKLTVKNQENAVGTAQSVLIHVLDKTPPTVPGAAAAALVFSH